MARELFQKAADGGNIEAQSALGAMYVMGEGGVEDFATGFALWQRWVYLSDLNYV